MKYLKESDQLINSLLGDCLHANTPQDLFNSLNRLKLGLEALKILKDISEK
jgi:hypothetical protein|tara:strand:+ start:342 stop:494 length:153 start_codon:yes stop_codon:yes gene_type:complete